MKYIALTLYLLGCYMQLHLGQNVLRLEGDNTHKIVHMVVGSLFWPLASCWYLAKRVFDA
jgi:hypothetical protein